MRIGFGVLLPVVVVFGLGVGAAAAAFQSGQIGRTAAGATASGGIGLAQGAAGGASSLPAADRLASGAAAGQVGPRAGMAAAGGTQAVGNMPVAGTVASVGDKQFSLQTDANATPVVVRVDAQTTISKQAAGSISDLKPDDRISVRGEAGTDGSIAAVVVQLVGADGGGAFLMGQGLQQGMRSQVMPAGTPVAGGSRVQIAQGAFVGTVKDVSGNVLTVARLGGAGQGGSEGATVKVTVSSQTTVLKTVPGEAKDIVAGASVTAIGVRGTNGELAATTIQIARADSPTPSKQ